MGSLARRKGRWLGAGVAAVVVAATLGAGGVAAAVPAAAAGAEVGAGDGALSPRLEVISEAPVSEDARAAAGEVEALGAELGLATSGAGALQVDAEARIAVSVYYSSGPTEADVAALAALGEVEAASALFARASASVAASQLAAVAALPNVSSVQEAVAPLSAGAAAKATAAATTQVARAVAGVSAGVAASVTAAASATVADAPGVAGGAPVAAAGAAAAAPVGDGCRTVEVNLAPPMNADGAAAEYEVDGSGITVGVISDSFDFSPGSLTTPEEDVEAGLLPGEGNPCGYTTPVEVIKEAAAAASDEGRAMAQLVHGIAPGARLLFAAAGQDELTFAESIGQLAEAGADVIVDDITMLTDPFYQNGPIGYMVEAVTGSGVTYLAAAGNFTRVGVDGHPSAGHPISAWETTEYRPTACPAEIEAAFAAQDITSADCMDFDPGAGVDATNALEFIATPPSRSITFFLQWAEPVGAAVGSFTFAFIDADGTAEIGPWASPGYPSIIGGTGVQNGEYQLVIVRDTSEAAGAAVAPPVKVVMVADPFLQAVEYYASEGDDTIGRTITGHAGNPDTIAVAASPFTTPETVEEYSSAGPSTHYFDYQPQLGPIATPLAEPEVTAQPSVTGVDGGWTNFFSADEPVGPGVYSFFGTSAASPAVAAVVALGRELRADVAPAQYRALLESTAFPLESPYPELVPADEIVGAGLTDATSYLEALAALPVPPTPTPTPTPVPVQPAADGSSELAATGASGALPVGAGALLVLLLGAGALAVLAATRRRGARRRTSR